MFVPLAASVSRRFRRALVRSLALGVVLAGWGASASGGEDKPAGQATVIVVVGNEGEEELGKQFKDAAALWEKTCERAGARRITIGLETSNPDADLERLQKALEAEPKESPNELWLILLGHGTYDGKEARFNLRGPDISASQLATFLAPFQRPLAVINSSSASAPFLSVLAGPGRVIVSATKSGSELNYTRFGGEFSKAVASIEADLDKDGQVSLLEAWLSASAGVAEFYKGEGRLATEHSLLDDNGDGLGTPSDWFRGVRAAKKAAEGASVDGRRAHQFHLIRSNAEKQLTAEARARRDELEMAVFKLRDDKPKLAEDEYYRQLETLLLELAKLYEVKPD